MDEKIAAALPAFPEEDLPSLIESIQGILRSGWLILGEHTHQFEDAFRRYIGTDFAVAVNSCTSALQITLRHLGANGREVIMPVNNFPGVITAVLAEGGTPVLADIQQESFCIDVDDAIARVTDKTAGMVVVHLAGLICPEFERLRAFCTEKGLFLIEDASHAHGATIGEQKAGSLADAGCFSFYPTKIMTTGTGGMITTDDSDLAEFARSVRHHGQGSDKALFVKQGNDWCMGEIQAAIGLQQLKRLDENVAHRNNLATHYRAHLSEENWLTIPHHAAEVRHAYYKFPVLLHPDIDARFFRQSLWQDFKVENGSIYDPPCHLQPVFADLLGLAEGAFPCAEEALSRQLCPPIHSSLSLAEVDRVVSSLKSVAARLSLEL